MKARLIRGDERVLKIIEREIHESVTPHVKKLLDTALRVAVEHTPRYSGEATSGWSLTVNPESIHTVASTADPEAKPKYPGGIHDPSAAALIGRSAASRAQTIASFAEKLRNKGKATAYLYNRYEHAQKWLGNDRTTARGLLRAVNHDFWTFHDINRALQQEMSKW